MKLGIMQPYFFPYIGYYSLINATDKWVVFDTPQYIRKGWVNRNKVLKTDGDTKYVGLAVQSAPRETPINEIKITSDNWKNKVINNLDYYKLVKAPQYSNVINMIEEAFSIESDNLSEIIINCLKTSCKYLNIDFHYLIFSEMDVDCSQVAGPGDWAFVISRELGADCYINPPGGESIFDKQKFLNENIDIKFLQHDLPEYNQNNESFVQGLSILDVMMFNNVAEIKDMLEAFKFV